MKYSSAIVSGLIFLAGAACPFAAEDPNGSTVRQPGGSRADAAGLNRPPILFADDSAITSRAGLERRLHPAATLDHPVVVADKPWEGDRVYIYGSVIADPTSGSLRMWYLGRPQQENTSARTHTTNLRSPGNLVLYATSHDGLNWAKPVLGINTFDGSVDNNIVFDLHSPAVIEDHFDPDPKRRFKMVGTFKGAYWAAYSGDGLHWFNFPRDPVLTGSDTITLAQDPKTGEYLAFHKRPATVRGLPRRVVWLARSRDFQHWSEPVLVFVPDTEDDTWATEPNARTEVYDMSVYPHATGFIGLPAIFRVMRRRDAAELGPGQSPADGPIDIQLATSRDGEHWQRSWPREAIIPRGSPGVFDGGAILGVSSTLVDFHDQTLVYYTAINTSHGAPMPPKRITVGRAAWRLHGFVSLDAGPDGGQLETIPVSISTEGVVINADASRGELTVALEQLDGHPLPGFGMDDSAALKTDSVRWRANWKSGQTLPTYPVKVKISAKNTRLYSLGGVTVAPPTGQK